MPEFFTTPAGMGAIAAAAVVLVAVIAAVMSRGNRKWDAVLDAPDDRPRPVAAPAKGPTSEAAGPSVFVRLVTGLSRTKERLVSGVDELFKGRKQIDEELWSRLEELLVTGDVGIRTTTRLLERMRKRAEKEELQDPARLREILRDEIGSLLDGCSAVLPEGREGGPLVIMVVGVNGAGKTTTIGKLAARYVRAGKKVIIGAGDTFRAAAIEQVVVWGKRSGAEVVKHGAGADPAAVAHDAVSAGIARGADVVICDTAGRLHSKSGLMDELNKVVRVVSKVVPDAPHEVLLVLDSTNGQNAIAQAREFAAVVGVTGIALTKLDGTARGGVIIGIADELDIPVTLIGIGEAVDDLRDFESRAFVDALFSGVGSGLGRGGNRADAAARDEELGIHVEEEAVASDARTQG
jgi:fused signal recognition particle receptor